MTEETLGAADAPSPGRRDLSYGDIEVGEPLGSGGTAVVHRARLPDGTPVALKQPRVEDTVKREVAERIVSEAATWADIDDHDHVVGLVDWDAEPVPWVAMEYMDGGDLADRIEDGPLPLETALRVGRQACAAVRYAHRHGIVHLDLTPANLLFRETDGPPVVKVADWGLARSLRDHGGSVDGLTPEFAAPEQFDRDAYGQPDDFTDCYQLGAVVYAATTGRPPFTGSNMEVMRAVLDERPDPPSAVNPDLPEAIDDVLLQALATEKVDRYETVVDLRRALAVLQGEPAEQRPGGPVASTEEEPSGSGSGDQPAGMPPGDQPDESAIGDETAGGSTGDGTAGGSTGDGTAGGSTGDGTAGGSTGDGTADGSTGDGTAGGSTGDGTADGSTGDAPKYGVVTGHSVFNSEPDDYWITLADTGEAVNTRGSQVADGVRKGDAVELEVMEIDDERHVTDAALPEGRVGETVDGVVTDHTEYNSKPDDYWITFVDTGESVTTSGAQVADEVVDGDAIRAHVLEIDGERHVTDARPPTREVGKSVQGIVTKHTEYSSEPDDYWITFADTGEATVASGAQVADGVVEGDPVDARVLDVDDDRYVVDATRPDDRLGQRVEGVVTDRTEYNSEPDHYWITFADTGESVATSGAQVADEVVDGDAVEAHVLEIDGDRYVTDARPM